MILSYDVYIIIKLLQATVFKYKKQGISNKCQRRGVRYKKKYIRSVKQMEEFIVSEMIAAACAADIRRVNFCSPRIADRFTCTLKKSDDKELKNAQEAVGHYFDEQDPLSQQLTCSTNVNLHFISVSSFAGYLKGKSKENSRMYLKAFKRRCGI